MALLLGLAMLPVGAIALQVGMSALEARQSAFEQTLGRRALQSIAVERGVFDEMREVLRVLATAPAFQDIAAGDCTNWLGAVMTRYPYIAAIAVSDDAGAVLCSVPGMPPGLEPRPSRVRDIARTRDGFAIGYVERGALSGEPVLAAMEPLRDETGRRIGFVGASVGVQQLRALLDRGRALDGARAAILDSTGRVIAESAVDTERRVPGLPTPEQVRNLLGPDPAFVDVQDGSAAIAPLQMPDLFIALSWRPERPTWRVLGALAFTLAAPMLIWALAIAAGWFAIEVYVTRPLSNLESSARSFARGEEVTDPPALAAAPEEIRGLRRTLAAMAKTLRGREQRLVEALAEERALLREVHHRVKNNLQLVASLLNIQARGARDQSEARGLAHAHERVQLLAMVHQRVYASGEVREVRVDDLAAEIARHLLRSRDLQDARTQFSLSEVRAGADRAFPLAFLIGEAISAALDAIEGAQDCTLSLGLAQDADEEVRFTLDIGCDAGAIAPPSGRLVEAFARQLNASIGRDPERPLSLWVRVPPRAQA